MASHLFGEPRRRVAGLLLPICSVRLCGVFVLGSCHRTRAHLCGSGRSVAIAGAVRLEPFPCPGLRPVPSGDCKCREKAAGEQPVLPIKGGSSALFTTSSSGGAHLAKLGCWFGSAPSSSKFQTPACLSQVVWEWSSQSPPIEAESGIPPDFSARAIYFQGAALAASPNHPFSLPC